MKPFDIVNFKVHISLKFWEKISFNNPIKLRTRKENILKIYWWSRYEIYIENYTCFFLSIFFYLFLSIFNNFSKPKFYYSAFNQLLSKRIYLESIQSANFSSYYLLEMQESHFSLLKLYNFMAQYNNTKILPIFWLKLL